MEVRVEHADKEDIQDTQKHSNAQNGTPPENDLGSRNSGRGAVCAPPPYVGDKLERRGWGGKEVLLVYGSIRFHILLRMPDLTRPIAAVGCVFLLWVTDPPLRVFSYGIDAPPLHYVLASYTHLGVDFVGSRGSFRRREGSRPEN